MIMLTNTVFNITDRRIANLDMTEVLTIAKVRFIRPLYHLTSSQQGVIIGSHEEH